MMIRVVIAAIFFLAPMRLLVPSAYADSDVASCKHYADTGKLKHAAACYTRKMKQETENTLARFSRARVYLAAGEYVRAFADFRAVAARVPWSKAYGGAAWAAYQGGRPQRGLSYAKKAVRLNPEDEHAWHTLGKIAQSVGDLSLAAHAFRKAWRLDPEHKKGFLELDEVHGHWLCCRG